MLTLLTNDDGIDSPVLRPVKAALDTIGDTLVFVPDRNWSASGHPKTMHKMIRADVITCDDGSTGYKSSGAPPDCVALVMLGAVDARPDLVVSGINLGANMGYDVFYSGTVAAAVEGVISGLPAIAFSREQPIADNNYTDHATFVALLAKMVVTRGLPAGTLLNVNFPAAAWQDLQGIAITRLGKRVYKDELVKRADPRGRDYYWIGGHPPSGVPEHGTDVWAIENNLISITPLALDITAHRLIDEVQRWDIDALFREVG